MSRSRKPLWRRGWVAYHPEAASALRSAYAAAALEAIHQRTEEDGWAAISDDKLADAVGCTRGTVPRIRKKLIARQVVELGEPDRDGRTRYRLLADALRELVPRSSWTTITMVCSIA